MRPPRSFQAAPACLAILACLAICACDAGQPGPTGTTSTADASSADLAATADSQPGADSQLGADTAAADVAQEDAAPDVVSPADVAEGSDTVEDTAAGTDAAVADAPAVDVAADASAATDAAADVDTKVCKPAEQKCEGAKLATCSAKGDGWLLSNCFPGMTCVDGSCKVVSNNLIVLFDTSGSMTGKVKDKTGKDLCPTNDYNTWPVCEYDAAKWPMGCTRMGVSKYVFKQALAKIDPALTKMALFRFPQKQLNNATSCSNGYWNGQSTITGAGNDESYQAPPGSAQFWNNLYETLCVGFPQTKADPTKDNILKWMNGTEQMPNDPELRPTGSTPIGKTLFYIGEYLRHKVMIDGKACTGDASCGNVNYVCKDSKCVDPSRSCRETTVVVFTDGGESDSGTYFSPRSQAKRLSIGLACATDADCAGGAACATFKVCKKGTIGNKCDVDGDCGGAAGACVGTTQCMPKESVTGFFCTQTNDPCLPDAKPGEPAYCNPTTPHPFGSCVKDPRAEITAKATKLEDNVLRSPNGKPFGVKVHIVDIGSISATELANSMRLAIAGGGKLLGTDASDPEKFLQALDAAFDFKNKKVCGQEF